MDILFVASELSPAVRASSLGDVVAALSKALRLLGHKVTVALPNYKALEASGLMLARRLTPLELQSSSGDPERVTVLDGRLGSGVELTVLDAPGLYDRAGIYGDGDVDYPDNARRFGLYARAVAELVRQRAASGTPFDLVHAHDWAGAIACYLLKHGGTPTPTKTMLTLHDLSRQGIFPKAALADLGLDAAHFEPSRLEFYGQVSFLKGGILAADALTTVSATYAREMLTPESGERLDGVLRSRGLPIAAIGYGVDYAVYNPATDTMLRTHYDAEDASNKGRCKSEILVELGLSVDPELPLLVALGPITKPKGGDLFATALPKITRTGANVVIAGAGDAALVAKLEAAVAKESEQARYLGAVDQRMIHRLLAAADAVLIPSRSEPCGLNQLYAQRYGAVPIATRAGGLADTIVDLEASLETGTGILIDSPTVSDLVGGVQRAVAAMKSPMWARIRRRMMRLDLGWDISARRYVSAYKALTKTA